MEDREKSPNTEKEPDCGKDWAADRQRRRRSSSSHSPQPNETPNSIHTVQLFDVPIVALTIDRRVRLCLAQISSTLLKAFSYDEIHNRRVALGINCVQCTPVQLEILRRAGAMPISSRRCGMITKREAERLVKSFLCETKPPSLPDDFAFQIEHFCSWGCQGKFMPSRYNSSRAKCIQCSHCQQFFSPNKFIFHSHKLPSSIFSPADAANFNSWRRHIRLQRSSEIPEELVHAWEDVKAMFNGGSRRRILTPTASVRKYVRPRTQSPPTAPASSDHPAHSRSPSGAPPLPACPPAPLSHVMNYASFLHPASLLHYDWLYRQHAASTASPYSFWMQQGAMGQHHELWPWNNAHNFSALAERQFEGTVMPFKAHETKKDGSQGSDKL